VKKVYSASVTPLLADGSLDVVGLRNILQRNVKHGLDGVFILGSMGEWGSFSDDFKENLVRESAAILSGSSAELLVGINATSLALSLQNLKRYRRYAFDSYVFMLPARTSALDPLKSILTVLDAADRPVFYYHCPPNNGIDLNLDQFDAIMAHPNLKGIKNSASNMWLRRELILLRKDRGYNTLLLEGQEWATDEAMLAGYDGMLCGLGALASKVMVAIARAVDQKSFPEAVNLQNSFIRLFHGVYGKKLQTVWVGQKYALVKLGLIETPLTLAQEMSTLTASRQAEIEQCLAEYKDILD